MSENDPNSHEIYEKLFIEAIDLRHQPTLYSNGVRLTSETLEFTLDFFNTTPNPQTNNQIPMSYLLARVTMNTITAQQLANILLDGLQRLEETIGEEIKTVQKKSIIEESTNNEPTNS